MGTVLFRISAITPSTPGLRGIRTKKRLVGEETEAAIIRRVYGMVLGREGLPLVSKA